ncbi:dTMP kinase [Alkaliphilus serpentinus]|uniref:Thymidylate kinase n=1 Tax=Alkaliphilus serpentinus TaxID=1482731 RepID=A0A833MAX2_9FIRM|nr:dTMP kinase [Alkaliphilus serpentinus]KAB3531808.1 dTMP kinase [Alkaliphilus serpentinus]
MKGKFITIEGLDGAGKSTQINYMKSYLEKKGFKVLLTREPGGTNIGEKIRDIVLDKAHAEMDSVTEALLYAASRAQHVSQVIMPALTRGEIVLCDRFVDSSMVYQGRGRNLGFDAVKAVNDFATRGLEPNLTLLFNINPDTSLKRINERGPGDRLEEEKPQFHFSVHKAYMDLAQRFTNRIKVINASQGIEDIRKEVEDILEKLIKEGEIHEVSNRNCT